MTFNAFRNASSALAAGLFCLVSQTAEAQAKPAVSNLTLVEGTSQLTASAKAQSDDLEEADKHPMGWAGIGVKLGVAAMTAGSASVMGLESSTPGRMGMQVSVPINLGGDGFSWTLEPYFMQSSMSHDLKSSTGTVVGSENVDLHALGIYTGPTFNIHATDALYVGFGFGLKGAYLMNDGFEYAADLYGRVPVHATYYVSRQLALVAEVGFGYGASAFADKPRVVVDPVSRSVSNVKDDPQLGLAYTWDATVGVRLP